MARSWCQQGGNVRFEDLLASEHVAALYEGYLRAEAWLAHRFAGKPAVSDCATI